MGVPEGCWAKSSFFSLTPATRASHDDPENSKRAYWRAPTLQTTEIPKDAQKDHKECNIRREEGKKKRKFGGPAEGVSGAGYSAGGPEVGCLEEGCLAQGLRRRGGRGRYEKMKNKYCAEIKKSKRGKIIKKNKNEKKN